MGAFVLSTHSSFKMKTQRTGASNNSKKVLKEKKESDNKTETNNEVRSSKNWKAKWNTNTNTDNNNNNNNNNNKSLPQNIKLKSI